MNCRFSPALEQLIREQMAAGQYASEESLLADALAALAAQREELSAVRRGLESFDAGEPGVTVDQAF
jgi:predicted transcriptional regulator